MSQDENFATGPALHVMAHLEATIKALEPLARRGAIGTTEPSELLGNLVIAAVIDQHLSGLRQELANYFAESSASR